MFVSMSYEIPETLCGKAFFFLIKTDSRLVIRKKRMSEAFIWNDTRRIISFCAYHSIRRLLCVTYCFFHRSLIIFTAMHLIWIACQINDYYSLDIAMSSIVKIYHSTSQSEKLTTSSETAKFKTTEISLINHFKDKAGKADMQMNKHKAKWRDKVWPRFYKTNITNCELSYLWR